MQFEPSGSQHVMHPGSSGSRQPIVDGWRSPAFPPEPAMAPDPPTAPDPPDAPLPAEPPTPAVVPPLPAPPNPESPPGPPVAPLAPALPPDPPITLLVPPVSPDPPVTAPDPALVPPPPGSRRLKRSEEPPHAQTLTTRQTASGLHDIAVNLAPLLTRERYVSRTRAQRPRNVPVTRSHSLRASRLVTENTQPT
jgi:hypothetical protein